jgi:hypothetical protein
LVGLNFPEKLHIKPTTYICYERERNGINRLERQDEMKVHEQDARWFKFVNFGSMLILVG